MTETVVEPVGTALDQPRTAPRRLSRRALVTIVVLIAVGVGVRLWIMTGRLGVIDSDEAITGLMARHLLRGEFRAFMWRINYQGTIATYPVALSLRLFGTNQFALELPFALMSAAGALLVWRIGARCLRPFQAAFAAFAFWLWPALYVWIGVKPLIFYVATMLLGLAMILCAQRAVSDEGTRQTVGWCVLGLCAGLGWWTSPNITYFLVPTAVWLLVFHWHSLWPRAFVAVPFAILGALPWLWNDAHYGWDSLHVTKGLARGSYLDHLEYFFTHALPAALGLRGYLDGRWILSGAGHVVLYGAALVLLAWSVVLGIRERSPVAIGLLTCPLIFATIPFASVPDTDIIGNGRYFYFFTPFLALGLARLARPIVPAVVLACALIATSVWGFTRLYDFRDSIGAGPPLDRVISRLEHEGHHEVFASFWISGRLTFDSGERIVAVGTDFGPAFQPFEDRVRRSKLPVFVFYTSDTLGQKDLRRRATAAGATLKWERVGDYTIAVPSAQLTMPEPTNIGHRP